jgi:hypothetical protein
VVLSIPPVTDPERDITAPAPIPLDETQRAAPPEDVFDVLPATLRGDEDDAELEAPADEAAEGPADDRTVGGDLVLPGFKAPEPKLDLRRGLPQAVTTTWLDPDGGVEPAGSGLEGSDFELATARALPVSRPPPAEAEGARPQGRKRLMLSILILVAAIGLAVALWPRPETGIRSAPLPTRQ